MLANSYEPYKVIHISYIFQKELIDEFFAEVVKLWENYHIEMQENLDIFIKKQKWKKHETVILIKHKHEQM